MRRCPDCLGKGEIFCPVCKGTRKDPRYYDRSCSYCGGTGHIRCGACMGKGTLEDSDDYKA